MNLLIRAMALLPSTPASASSLHNPTSPAIATVPAAIASLSVSICSTFRACCDPRTIAGGGAVSSRVPEGEVGRPWAQAMPARSGRLLEWASPILAGYRSPTISRPGARRRRRGMARLAARHIHLFPDRAGKRAVPVAQGCCTSPSAGEAA